MPDEPMLEYCARCQCAYELQLIDSRGICIDCREGGHCGTSKCPPGYTCTRPPHEDGPCAAHPICGHDQFTFANTTTIPCPCVLDVMGTPCPGVMTLEGPNVKGDLFFLACSHCACGYHAEKFIRKEQSHG